MPPSNRPLSRSQTRHRASKLRGRVERRPSSVERNLLVCRPLTHRCHLLLVVRRGVSPVLHSRVTPASWVICWPDERKREHSKLRPESEQGESNDRRSCQAPVVEPPRFSEEQRRHGGLLIEVAGRMVSGGRQASHPHGCRYSLWLGILAGQLRRSRSFEI